MSDAPVLRIGIDMRRVDPVESGQQRYLWRLGAWLAEQGEDVHFLTVLRQPAQVAVPAGTMLHRMHGLPRSQVRRRVHDLALDVLLINPERSRAFRGIRANLLRPAYGTERYIQKLRSFRSPARGALRRAARAVPWEIAERHWERAFYERTKPPPHVIAVSGYMRNEILRSYAIPPDRVHVVHNGIDPAEFSPARRLALRAEQRDRRTIPGDATCLLFMGHNFRLKGLWQLMEIVADLRRESPAANLHLLVAGRGTGNRQRHAARRLTRRLGLEGVVHLAGPVRPAIAAFAAADAFIHLSWHDSFGFVTLEAMATGLPVITTPFVGAAEVIEDGASGIIVDPAHPAAVRDAVRRLLDAGSRARLGESAANVGARLTEAANFERVSAIMRRAAADGGVG